MYPHITKNAKEIHLYTNGIDDIYVNPQKGARYQCGVSYRIGRNPVLK